MPQSNKDRQQRRWERKRKIRDSICDEIRYWVGHWAAVTAQPDTWFREYTTGRHVMGHPGYNLLNAYDIGFIDGTWEHVFYKVHWAKLQWTHVLDDERFVSKSNDDRLTGRYQELKDGESAHAYLFRLTDKRDDSTREVLIPFQSDARQADITAGRLTEELISTTVNAGCMGFADWRAEFVPARVI